MAGHPRHLRAARAGSRFANPHRPHPPARRTLRHPAAQDHRGIGDARCPRGRTPSKDGGGMEVKSGYKQTEVGVIPEEWDVKALWETGEALIGLTYKPTDVRQHGTLVLRSSNIQNDALAFDDNVFVDAAIPERIR